MPKIVWLSLGIVAHESMTCVFLTSFIFAHTYNSVHIVILTEDELMRFNSCMPTLWT